MKKAAQRSLSNDGFHRCTGGEVKIWPCVGGQRRLKKKLKKKLKIFRKIFYGCPILQVPKGFEWVIDQLAQHLYDRSSIKLADTIPMPAH